MPLEIPFYRQETGTTCGPACARMILGALGHHVTERKLVKFFGTGPHGTVNKMFAELAEELRLSYTVRRNGDLKQIEAALKEGYLVITCYFDEKESKGHYAVVADIGPENIYLLDPYYGPNHILKKKYFVSVWHNGWEPDKRWFIALQQPKQ